LTCAARIGKQKEVIPALEEFSTADVKACSLPRLLAPEKVIGSARRQNKSILAFSLVICLTVGLLFSMVILGEFQIRSLQASSTMIGKFGLDCGQLSSRCSDNEVRSEPNGWSQLPHGSRPNHIFEVQAERLLEIAIQVLRTQLDFRLQEQSYCGGCSIHQAEQFWTQPPAIKGNQPVSGSASLKFLAELVSASHSGSIIPGPRFPLQEDGTFWHIW
jgi:hypothetical protein